MNTNSIGAFSRLDQAAKSQVFGTELEALRTEVRRFFDDEVTPLVGAWERDGRIPLSSILFQMSKRGWVGMRFPKQFGGGERDLLTHAVLAEEMGRVPCGGFGMAVTVHIDMTAPLIANHGSEELKEQFLVPALRGECVLAHALSERAAGADMAGVNTIASEEAEEFVITGSKAYVCNASTAHAYGLMARIEGARSPFNMVLIVVPRNVPGVKVGPPLRPLGNRACDLADVHFDRVRVPKRFQLGANRFGLVHQVQQFRQERILSACRANSAAEFHLSLARTWCRSRTTFGRSLLENQALRYRLAELETDVRLSQQLTYAALTAWRTGHDYTSLSAMAKLRSSRAARRVAEAYLQLSGAAGFLDDSLAARFYRDSRLYSIATGADEVMLMSLTRDMRWEEAS